MALLDMLASMLTGQGGNLTPGQTANAIAPGQSAAPGGQSSMPMSELIAQSVKHEQPLNPTGPTNVQGLTVSPSVPSSTGPVSKPNPATVAPPVDLQSAQDQQLTGGMGDLVTQDPQGSTLNYNNSQQANDVHAALNAEPRPQGGMANPGLYGLLPQGLQHGVLRNILGKIGDAYTGTQRYEDRMEGQEMGNAMAGMDINDPNSVAAANQRIMATGDVGASALVEKNQELAEQAALRKQYMQYNNDYRSGMLGVAKERASAQQAAVADRYRPQIGGMLSGVTNAADYNTKYQSLVPLAKQIGGADATPASVFSIPEPGAWTPGLTAGYGQTAGQQLMSGDRRRGQDMTQQNSQGRDRAIMSRPGPQPNQVNYLQGLIARDNGQGAPLNPDEKAYLTRNTAPPRGAGRALPPGLTPNSGGGPPVAPTQLHGGTSAQVGGALGGLAGGGGNLPTYTPAQAASRSVPPGTHFRGTDGQIRIKH